MSKILGGCAVVVGLLSVPQPGLAQGFVNGFAVGEAQLGEIYLWDNALGVVGCLSCGEFGGPFSPISRYIDRFDNFDDGSPCNPDTAGRAKLRSYAGQGNWIFQGRFTKNVDIRNGICSVDSRYRWESACESLRKICDR